MAYEILNQCCKDAWEVIRGRKRIVGNKIISIAEDRADLEKENAFGWLSPDGTFYPVNFGEHQKWAAQYLLSLRRNGKISHEEAKLDRNYNVGDILVKRGWVLLHSPQRDNVKIEKNPIKRLTKRQQDFLYDYLRKIGEADKANMVISEEF